MSKPRQSKQQRKLYHLLAHKEIAKSKSFTCAKLSFHIPKDPQNDSYHFSLSLVWLIKRTAESKLYCKKDFHEIIRQCSCLTHTQKHYITLDLIMHCTYHFPCGLSFRFQISLSLAAMALSYSCHNMNLFWLKAVGLQFISRNDNHNFQILIWFSRLFETNHVSYPPHLKTMGWCYWDIQLLILPNVFLICIYNFIVTWDWLACFMSIHNLNYVTLSRFLSKVALLLKMLMRKLFA